MKRMMGATRATLMVAMMLGLSACTVRGPALEDESLQAVHTEIEQARRSQSVVEQAPPELPDAVSQALLPDYGSSAVREARFDLNVENMPAAAFFMGLVHGTRYNMVLHPGVSGEISLSLRAVTIEEVMDIVSQSHGFEYTRAGDVWHVLSQSPRTELFHLDYLGVRRSGRSDTRVSAGSVSDAGGSDSEDGSSFDSGSNATIGTQIETRIDSDFWQELQRALEALVSSEADASVLVSPQTGLVVVRATPAAIHSVADYLQRSQLILDRQVLLEAKILEVTLNDGFQAGIQWSTLLEAGGANKTITLDQTSQLLSNANVAGVFSATLDLGDFGSLIQLLETQGTVQVLSSPRVATVNNQKAVIKVGTDEFFVTDVSSTTTTGTSTTTTPEVELTPFFSGIALDVTPQIGADEDIVLHVHPTISEVEDQVKVVSVGADQFTLPLALSTIRESDSIIRARSGQVVVIGGLMQNSSEDTNAQTPLLGNIPLIGSLFRQKRQTSVKSELVILLRSTVADSDTWRASMDESGRRFRQLHHGIQPRAVPW